MWNARLDEAQAGIKSARRNINNLRYADDTTLMAESEVKPKSLLIKVKEESEKACLKLNIQKTKIMASCPITSRQIDGEITKTGTDFLPRALKSLQMVTTTKKSYDQPRQYIKEQRHHFANKDLSSQSYGFSSSHVWMWELNHKESWVLKNWCFWTVVLEKTLESPLDCKEIKPVNPKGKQSWIFIGRTEAEAEISVLWALDVKNWLVGKDPDAGKDWMQEEKEMTGDEMVGWHHWLNGHELEQALGLGDGQESQAFCSPWGHKESDMTEWLNWTEVFNNIGKILQRTDAVLYRVCLQACIFSCVWLSVTA